MPFRESDWPAPLAIHPMGAPGGVESMTDNLLPSQYFQHPHLYKHTHTDTHMQTSTHIINTSTCGFQHPLNTCTHSLTHIPKHTQTRTHTDTHARTHT